MGRMSTEAYGRILHEVLSLPRRFRDMLQRALAEKARSEDERAANTAAMHRTEQEVTP